MSGKPETRFYSAVHKLLPSTLHREKMHNVYRGGTADVWYSGNADDLWVEYKWLPKVPKKALIRLDKLLSPVQLLWLRGRYEEGRNVVVILGTPEGAWIFENRNWESPLDPQIFRRMSMSRQFVSDYIRRRTCLNEHALAVPRNDGKFPRVSSAVHDADDVSVSAHSHETQGTEQAIGFTPT